MDKKEQARIRKQRQRDRERYDVTQLPESVTLSPDDVTQDVTHPVMKYIVKGKDRDKMERIVQSLKKHNQLSNIYLGCGKTSLPLDIVGEMLEVTE